MQNESTIEVQAEDKLRWLRRLDGGGRGWESLDDRRVCRYCGKTFSGRQVQLVGGTRGVVADITMTKRDSFFANAFGLLKQTFSEWLEDKAPQLGAALAYYTVFSLAPLILVLLAIIGLIFQNDPAGAWKKITER